MKIKYPTFVRKASLALLSASLLVFSSCGDFLEATSQDQDYVRSWEDLNELLLGSAYMPVKNASTMSSIDACDYGTFLHLVGDELEEINTKGVGTESEPHYYIFGYYTWQQRSGQNETYTDYYTENIEWTKMYNAINVTNNVIEKASTLPQLTDEEKQGYLKVTGEAYFLRAWYYFWLVNTYAKPYDPQTAATDPGVAIKTTSPVEEKQFTRDRVQAVYDLVLADLDEADARLSQYTGKRKSIYRADSVSVHLLKSRVYLYMQNWSKAAFYAQKVINEHPALMDIVSNSTSFMTKDNPENIFSMGGDCVPMFLLPGIKGMTVSKDTYANYTTNDKRKTRWFWNLGPFHGLTKRPEGTRTDPLNVTDQKYYYQKYYLGHEGDQSDVSSLFWLRSSEAYLNLAEAKAYMGDMSAAKQTLKEQMSKRYNAGSPELDIQALSDSELITRIREERRREFLLEGHRWFDLRRYRVCNVQPSKISITHDYTYYVDHNSEVPTETRRFVLTEDDASWTLPMPNEVLDFNIGMETNGNAYRTYTTVKVY